MIVLTTGKRKARRRLVHLHLGFQEQRVKTGQEKLPRQDWSILETIGNLPQALQDDGSVNDDRVELQLQAPTQKLKTMND